MNFRNRFFVLYSLFRYFPVYPLTLLLIGGRSFYSALFVFKMKK